MAVGAETAVGAARIERRNRWIFGAIFGSLMCLLLVHVDLRKKIFCLAHPVLDCLDADLVAYVTKRDSTDATRLGGIRSGERGWV